MPLSGGPAEKFGNRYEGRWTVACILEVMDERADSIRLEPPGPEGQGFEFWMKKQGIREYHQVKRQHSTGRWTLHTLARDGVLTNFATRLEDETAHCVFVSSIFATELAELSDRARRSESWEEFNKTFLEADGWKKNFNRVQDSFPGLPEKATYERLRRVYVESISEGLLRTTIESRVSPLVNGDAASVVDILANMASENVHSELSAHDIWKHLASRGLSRRRWDKDPHVLSAVSEANQRYLAFLRDQAIGGAVLPREEAQTVNTLLKGTSGKDSVMVTGEAGVGKSMVMFQVVEELLGDGAPVLAFRADRLEPTQLPDRIGEQLGLPGSPPNVLAAVARGNSCVLVIDQLDALSLASGRNTEVFDCINEIIRQAQAHPKMSILLACRKFDLDNDYRLRRLTDSDGIAETVTVNRLPWNTVRQVISGFGLDADALNGKQLELLSIPLHLQLLSALVMDDEVRALTFEKAQDLYERFWQDKQRIIKERIGRPVQWTNVITALCDYMHHHETLTAPDIIVDEWISDAEAMASENILIRDSKRFSFFHEGFFDYSYARLFAGDAQTLLQLLQGGEQRLFRRAQVRQILLFLRDADFGRYTSSLKEVLFSSEVRFHIKQVAFAVLADLSEPKEEEWDIVSSFAGHDVNDPMTRHASAVVRRLPWFKLVDSLGLVQHWLDDPDDAFVDHTLRLLSVLQRQTPDRVAELVDPYVGKSDRWDTRLFFLAQWADWSEGRRFLQLMLRLIDEGILDDAKGPIAVNSDFWSLLYPLQFKHPSWGCEIVGHYLNRRLRLSRDAGKSNPFDYNNRTIPDSQPAEAILRKLGIEASNTFVQEVFPFMLEVIEDVAPQKGTGLRRDPIWSFRVFQSGYGIDSALLQAMEDALSALAVHETEVFRSVIEAIVDSPFETIQYLLLRSFASHGLVFADDGVDHLCDQPDRLKIGYSSDSHWAARQLIDSISPHCSDEKLKQLETLLLGYYPEWEKTDSGRRYYGYAQFTLLDGIVPTRRSIKVDKRLEELRRKFGHQEPESPRPMKVERIVSPIPEEAAAQMSDKQWLSAIKRHDNTQHGLRRDGRLAGSGLELSRVLENQVKQEPERFAALVSQFPDDAIPFYFEAVLRGINDATLDTDTVVAVCLRCHGIDGRPLGSAICETIANLGQGEVPAEALDIVAWYATEDPAPQQELWRTLALPSSDFYYGGDILGHGINTVRGGAARAIARLIESNHQRTTYLQPVLEKMVQDPSIAVRSCVAQALIAVLRYDRDLAIELFKQLCETEDVLLKTRFIERFIYFGIQPHFEVLSPVLLRMVNSQVPEVASVGARQASVAGLDLHEAAGIAALCLSGSEAQKVGAAEVMAANITTATCRSFCEDALITLFNDPSDNVRAEAARCFLRFEGHHLDGYDHLIAQFVCSDAFPKNYFPLLVALEQTTAKLPEITLAACERFIAIAGMAASDISARQAGDADTVAKLTLRIYQQSSDDAVRARSLDLIDRLMEHGAYGIDSALEQFAR